jgi:hypothetical protein
MAALYYRVLVRSEKRERARRLGNAKRSRKNSKKLTMASSKLQLDYMRKRWRRSARRGLQNWRRARSKKQQRDAATSQKSRDTPNKGKRKASQSAAPKSTKKRRVVGAESGVDVPSPLPQPPPKTTTRDRQIKVPQKFKWYKSCARLYIVLHHKIPR